MTVTGVKRVDRAVLEISGYDRCDKPFSITFFARTSHFYNTGNLEEFAYLSETEKTDLLADALLWTTEDSL